MSDLYVQDPDETATYAVDFSELLGADEEVTDAAIVIPEDVNWSASAPVVTGSTITWQLSGVEIGQDHYVTARATTSTGQIIDRPVYVMGRAQVVA